MASTAPTAAVQPAGSQPAPDALSTHVFLDLAWLERVLGDVATKRFGPQWSTHAAVDAAPLLPFLVRRTSEAVVKRPLSVHGAFAYAHTPTQAGGPRAFDALRVCVEEGWLVRNFDVLNGAAAGVTPCAPAIALTADLVHAASLTGAAGSLDAYVGPRSPAGSSGRSTDPTAPLPVGPSSCVIAAIGSPQYTPALIRASQHTRHVVIASAGRDLGRIMGSLPPETRELSPAVVMDSAINDMLVPIATFRAAALPLSELAAAVHASVVAKFGPGADVPSTEVVTLMANAGLLKNLRRHGVALRTLLRGAPSLFSTTDAAGLWTARALPAAAAAVLPATSGSQSRPDATSSKANAPARGETRPAQPHRAGANATKPHQQQQAPQDRQRQQLQQRNGQRPQPHQSSKRTAAPREVVSTKVLPAPTPAPKSSDSATPGTVPDNAVAAAAVQADATPVQAQAEVTSPVSSTETISEAPAASLPVDVGSSGAETSAAASTTALPTVATSTESLPRATSPEPASASTDTAVAAVTDSHPKLIEVLAAAAATKAIPDAKPKKGNFSALWAASKLPTPKGAWKMTAPEWRALLVQRSDELLKALRT